MLQSSQLHATPTVINLAENTGSVQALQYLDTRSR